MPRKKKIAITIINQFIVYVLVYMLEPFIMSYFNIGGDLFHTGWLFTDTLGGAINLLLVPLLTIIVMKLWVCEFRYWFVWIPVYIVMKLIYYPEGAYVILFGLDKFSIDFAFVSTFAIQFLSWLMVKLIKYASKNKRKS